jgi:hypothetical protein
VNLHIAHLPKLIAQRRSTAILGMIIITMLWVGIAFKYFERVRTDQIEAERTNENFAMVFEENVLRSLSEVDKAILYLRHSVETRKDTTDYNTIIRTTDVLSEIIVQAAIVDAQGIIRSRRRRSTSAIASTFAFICTAPTTSCLSANRWSVAPAANGPSS